VADTPKTPSDRAALKAQSSIFMSVGTGLLSSFVITFFFEGRSAIQAKPMWFAGLLVATILALWQGYDLAHRAEE
jgi:hypothetical protein